MATVVMPDFLRRLTRPVLQGDQPLPESVFCHFDGLCEPWNPGGIATVAWAVLDSREGQVLRKFHAVLADGGEQATNNWAEWVAFGTLLHYLIRFCNVRDIEIVGDSKLVVSQFNGDWQTRAEHLQRMKTRALELASEHLQKEGTLAVSHVLRDENMAADSLSEAAFFAYAKPWLIQRFHEVKRRRHEQKAGRGGQVRVIYSAYEDPCFHPQTGGVPGERSGAELDPPPVGERRCQNLVGTPKRDPVVRVSDGG